MRTAFMGVSDGLWAGLRGGSPPERPSEPLTGPVAGAGGSPRRRGDLRRPRRMGRVPMTPRRHTTTYPQENRGVHTPSTPVVHTPSRPVSAPVSAPKGGEAWDRLMRRLTPVALAVFAIVVALGHATGRL